MKTIASQFGSGSPAVRSTLKHLGEGPHSFEHHQRANEASSPSSMAGAPGQAAGVPTGETPSFHREARVQSDTLRDDGTSEADAENVQSVTGGFQTNAGVSLADRKDGVTLVSNGSATKFAAVLARVVAAADASGARGKAEATEPPGQSMSERDLPGGELGDEEPLFAAEPVVAAGEPPEIAVPGATVSARVGTECLPTMSTVDAQTTALPTLPKRPNATGLAPTPRHILTDAVRVGFVPAGHSPEAPSAGAKSNAPDHAQTGTSPKPPALSLQGRSDTAAAARGKTPREASHDSAPSTGGPVIATVIASVVATTKTVLPPPHSADLTPNLDHSIAARKSAAAPNGSVSGPTPVAENGSGSPSREIRREPNPEHPHHPAVAPLVAPVMAPAFSIDVVERSASSAPAKVTSQTLEVEYASRRRGAPASTARPRKPARVPRRETSPRPPVSLATPSATVELAHPSWPSTQGPASIASPLPTEPASPQGRIKLPSLIPLDGGLRLATLQRFASPAPHPTSPVDTNAPPPATAASLPGLESRRVRAAVLDRVQRSVPESSLATSASRKGIDTASSADKGGSGSTGRAPMLINGGTRSSERPMFVASLRASTAESSVSRDGAPVGQRRVVRGEHSGGAPHRPSIAAPHTVPPVLASTLSAPSPLRATKSASEADPSPLVEAAKASLAILPALSVPVEPLAGSRVDRSASPPSVVRPANEAGVTRVTATPAAHTAVVATSQELRAADLAPASSSPARALLDQAAADPSLYAAAIGNNAHLRLETGNAGSLSLHLHVRDGVADLEVEGTGSLEFRPQEIRRALAGEGIALGRFETRTSEVDSARNPDAAVAQASGSASSSSNENSGSKTNDSAPATAAENPQGAVDSFASTTGSSSSFSEGRRSWNSNGSDGRDRDPRAGSDTVQSPATTPTGGPRRRRGFHVMA